MTPRTTYIALPSVAFNPKSCKKGAWLVLLHAKRMPPHAGLLINGVYNSLTIKGHELNVSYLALLKTIDKRKIETIFIKLAPQPVFSLLFQTEIFMEIIKKENPVTPNGATCLSPIKSFFREFYGLDLNEEELLFEFVGRLNENKFIEQFSACNFTAIDGVLELPVYTTKELNERIINERLPFYNN
jgi:hypothetical protein